MGDDIVSKVQEAAKTPNSSGNYHDFIELLKLYDKNNNGTMMLAELETLLANMGDEIPKEDVQKLLAELCDPEDEDGMFPYTPFVDRMTGKAELCKIILFHNSYYHQLYVNNLYVSNMNLETT